METTDLAPVITKVENACMSAGYQASEVCNLIQMKKLDVEEVGKPIL